jgi:cyclopropane fatty-acyl-phospholipid synthase-like methyltransferase
MHQSPSALRNREPIYNILSQYITADSRLLDIGSGDGTHAMFIASKINGLHWITTEQKENIGLLTKNLKEAKCKNIHGPEILKIGVDDFPKGSFDYVFTANTFHIMPWKEVKSCIKLFGKRLREGALVFIYGPFNYQGKFTSKSNMEFDQWLKNRASHMGVRHFEDVEKGMKKAGFKLLQDHTMPANNRLLVFERLAFTSKR